MVRTTIASILVGALGTAFITWALVLFAKASTSADSKVRRTQRFLEIFMYLSLGGIYILTAESPKERKLWEVVLALSVSVWIFRGARSLLARIRAQ
jgi:hypothetical protein